MLGVGRQKFSGDKSWGGKSLAEAKVTFLNITSGVPMDKSPVFFPSSVVTDLRIGHGIGPRAFGAPRFWGPAQLSPITTRY